MKYYACPNNRINGRAAAVICSWACKAKRFVLTASTGVATMFLLAMPVYAADETANDIREWLDRSLTDLYQKFLGVSTIAACVAASVCLIMMNFSTDDRAVSTSRAWLKRILISWIILNVLGFIMSYLVTLTAGGSYSVTLS